MVSQRDPHRSTAPGIACSLDQQSCIKLGTETLTPLRLLIELFGQLGPCAGRHPFLEEGESELAASNLGPWIVRGERFQQTYEMAAKTLSLVAGRDTHSRDQQVKGLLVVPARSQHIGQRDGGIDVVGIVSESPPQFVFVAAGSKLKLDAIQCGLGVAVAGVLAHGLPIALSGRLQITARLGGRTLL